MGRNVNSRNGAGDVCTYSDVEENPDITEPRYNGVRCKWISPRCAVSDAIS
jgi:hypothetical protein